MTADLVLTNGHLVLPDEVVNGSLIAADGLIRDVSPARSDVAGVIDLDGDYLLPGLVDLHTDNLEKHVLPRPGVRWHALSAVLAHDAQVVSAGVTTVFDSLCVGSSLGTPERNELLAPMVNGLRTARASNLLRADHLLHMRCEVTDESVVELFQPFADDPLVRLMSVMDHAPGQRQSPDVGKYRDRSIRRLLLTPEEVDRQIEKLMTASATIGPVNRAALIAIGRANGIPIASHDDETVAHVVDASREGVIISEFPTTRAAAEAARAHSLSILMGSPNVIRGGSHTGNVAAQDLARDGLLDILSSDYIPISLVQSAFALATTPAGYSLPAAVRTVSLNPAEAIGFCDRGAIAVGRRADLVRVRLVDDLPVVRAVWREGRQVY